MKRYAALINFFIASGSLFSATHVTYTCINGNDLVAFSYLAATGNATFSYQDSQSEGLSLTNEQLIVQKNGNTLQVIGIISNHSRFFGVRAFFPVPETKQSTVIARIKFTDIAGLPVSNEMYECGIENIY